MKCSKGSDGLFWQGCIRSLKQNGFFLNLKYGKTVMIQKGELILSITFKGEGHSGKPIFLSTLIKTSH